jgi:phospholipid/cholesterol/gamma-HCH transport system ATP-binding protein
VGAPTKAVVSASVLILAANYLLTEAFFSMIRLRGRHKAFGAKRVLRGHRPRRAAGESLVVIGGSGTGKSVLLKCILGLVTPDSGRSCRRRRMRGRRGDATPSSPASGCCFRAARCSTPAGLAERRLPPAARPARRPRAEARAIAIEKLRRVGLRPRRRRPLPGELSGGMQKRVGLARAIAAEPEIIFFDEPTTGLDPIMAGSSTT